MFSLVVVLLDRDLIGLRDLRECSSREHVLVGLLPELLLKLRPNADGHLGNEIVSWKGHVGELVPSCGAAHCDWGFLDDAHVVTRFWVDSGSIEGVSRNLFKLCFDSRGRLLDYRLVGAMRCCSAGSLRFHLKVKKSDFSVHYRIFWVC